MNAIQHPRRLIGYSALACAALLSACTSTPLTDTTNRPATPSAKVTHADITPETVRIFVNRVNRPFTLVRNLRSEVLVSDADSEQAAELQAFKEVLHQARQAGADSVMDVRRSITRDGVAERANSDLPRGSSNLFKDDLNPTATALDDLTLADYWRGKGTLSASRIDRTFQRRDLGQKAVVFTAKAIRLN
jgi:hypothetical protein